MCEARVLQEENVWSDDASNAPPKREANIQETERWNLLQVGAIQREDFGVAKNDVIARTVDEKCNQE